MYQSFSYCKLYHNFSVIINHPQFHFFLFMSVTLTTVGSYLIRNCNVLCVILLVSGKKLCINGLSGLVDKQLTLTCWVIAHNASFTRAWCCLLTEPFANS